MSQVKRDLMKEIEARVARKKTLSQQVSRQKTVATWVAEFFTEFEKTRQLGDIHGYNPLEYLALDRLAIQLRSLDRKCQVDLKQNQGQHTVEIRWSNAFVQANNCEEFLVFDASSAFFQSAMEEL